MTTGTSDQKTEKPPLDPAAPPEEFDQAAEFEALAAEAEQLEPTDDTPPEDLPPPGPSTAEVLGQVIGPACAILAPGWQIQPEEVEQLSISYAAVVDKYWPGGVNLGPEISAALITVAIFGPRLGMPRRLPPPQPDKKQQERPPESEPPPDTGAKPKEPQPVGGLAYDMDANNGPD
ncbi:MAG: hypothetical protein OQL08_01465 [Gammaproteobacteria bacterium]|nr:hypothetical protein [Gammaproteobacteria bacterium]